MRRRGRDQQVIRAGIRGELNLTRVGRLRPRGARSRVDGCCC